MIYLNGACWIVGDMHGENGWIVQIYLPMDYAQFRRSRYVAFGVVDVR